MRLSTYVRDGLEHVGAWIDSDRRVVDMAKAGEIHYGKTSPGFASMQAFIEGGAACLDRARSIVADPPDEAVFATPDCTLLAPMPRPAQIRDCLCFPQHLQNARKVTADNLIKAAPDPARRRAELEAAGLFSIPPDYYDFPVYYISNRMSVVGPDVDVAGRRIQNSLTTNSSGPP